MAHISDPIDVYLEVGEKKTLAGAIDWPGWCRGGRDEASALAALVEYGPRYADVLKGTRLGFHAPKDVSQLKVVERLKGNATTDFGAPDMATSADHEPIADTDLKRFEKLLRACWDAFDAAARSAQGKELRKGPRGGGRELEKIVEHVLGSDQGYLSAVGWKLKKTSGAGLDELLAETRAAILDALRAAASGELPERGPRGGKLWQPRYYVRRSTWHVLDHVWEIEDRVE
jgi:hypothetical protein